MANSCVLNKTLSPTYPALVFLAVLLSWSSSMQSSKPLALNFSRTKAHFLVAPRSFQQSWDDGRLESQKLKTQVESRWVNRGKMSFKAENNCLSKVA